VWFWRRIPPGARVSDRRFMSVDIFVDPGAKALAA
jgi:hypothetical protein